MRLSLNLINLFLVCLLCVACSNGEKRRPHDKNQPSSPSSNTPTDNDARVDIDAWLASPAGAVDPSPFADCTRGMVESFTATAVTGWVLNTCELAKGNLDLAWQSGVIVYLQGEQLNPTKPATNSDVGFVPAASAGTLISPATAPTPYVASRATKTRRILYKGKELTAAIGFDIPLAAFVQKGNVLRIDGLSASELAQKLQLSETKYAAYSSYELTPFDFSLTEPLASADLANLRNIPQQRFNRSSTVLPVHIRVITQADGAGNELWDASFIKTMLQRASDIGQGNFTFSLQSIEGIKDTPQYNMSQWDVLRTWNPRLDTRKSGEIVAYISHPTLAGTDGLSWIQTLYTPIIVMRARQATYKDFALLHNTALIFLHEMGHESNLDHDNGSGAVHADAFDDPFKPVKPDQYKKWLDHVTPYYQELVKRTGEPPVCISYDHGGGDYKC